MPHPLGFTWWNWVVTFVSCAGCPFTVLYDGLQLAKGVALQCMLYSDLGQSGQTSKIGLDSWLLPKIALDSCPISSKITFIQPCDDRINQYLAFDLIKSYLDFWLLLWPRTKIGVQDILECHPLDLRMIILQGQSPTQYTNVIVVSPLFTSNNQTVAHQY